MARPASTLVLGGSGFLGLELVRALLERDPGEVIAASRHPGGVGRLDLPRDAVCATLDLEVPRALEALLDELRPARVLNSAALARAADCEREPERAQLMNADLPARAAAWCAQHGARFVHVSTDLVFGREPAPPGGFREHDLPAPLGAYGETKVAGERAVLAAHPGALVARIALLFGDSRGRGLGASDALLAAVERGERPRLHIDEWRTPLDVRDAADALVELARGEQRGLLHLAGSERLSRLQLGLLVLLARGSDPIAAQALVEPAHRASFHGGPPRAEDTSLDASRARALLRVRLRGAREALACGSA